MLRMNNSMFYLFIIGVYLFSRFQTIESNQLGGPKKSLKKVFPKRKNSSEEGYPNSAKIGRQSEQIANTGSNAYGTSQGGEDYGSSYSSASKETTDQYYDASREDLEYPNMSGENQEDLSIYINPFESRYVNPDESNDSSMVKTGEDSALIAPGQVSPANTLIDEFLNEQASIYGIPELATAPTKDTSGLQGTSDQLDPFEKEFLSGDLSTFQFSPSPKGQEIQGTSTVDKDIPGTSAMNTDILGIGARDKNYLDKSYMGTDSQKTDENFEVGDLDRFFTSHNVANYSDWDFDRFSLRDVEQYPEEGSSKQGTGYPYNTMEDVLNARDNTMQAMQPEGYTMQAPGYNMQVPGYSMQAPGYNMQAQGYNMQVPGYNMQAPGYTMQAPGYTMQAQGYNMQAPGYNMQAPGYNMQAPGYNMQAPEYNMQASENNTNIVHPEGDIMKSSDYTMQAPENTMQPQDYNLQVMQPQDYNEQVMQPQDYNVQAMQPQAYNEQVMQPQDYNVQVMQPQNQGFNTINSEYNMYGLDQVMPSPKYILPTPEYTRQAKGFNIGSYDTLNKTRNQPMHLHGPYVQAQGESERVQEQYTPTLSKIMQAKIQGTGMPSPSQPMPSPSQPMPPPSQPMPPPSQPMPPPSQPMPPPSQPMPPPSQPVPPLKKIKATTRKTQAKNTATKSKIVPSQAKKPITKLIDTFSVIPESSSPSTSSPKGSLKSSIKSPSTTGSDSGGSSFSTYKHTKYPFRPSILDPSGFVGPVVPVHKPKQDSRTDQSTSGGSGSLEPPRQSGSDSAIQGTDDQQPGPSGMAMFSYSSNIFEDADRADSQSTTASDEITEDEQRKLQEKLDKIKERDDPIIKKRKKNAKPYKKYFKRYPSRPEESYMSKKGKQLKDFIQDKIPSLGPKFREGSNAMKNLYRNTVNFSKRSPKRGKFSKGASNKK